MTLAPALGLDAARALDPAAFAIGVVTPRIAVRPSSREELSEALRAAARDGLAVVPWGGGVSLPRDHAPERYDVAIQLGGLSRMVEYEPADLTLTAECGTTLAALADALGARGQDLPIEGARAERATLGGALAANASGPRRLRYGAPRDRILGARFALGDGTIVRTGGRVVKNVAGYAIHRLLCGSRGGLAILVEASLKLVPVPQARAALVYPLDAGRLADAGAWAAVARVEPSLATVVGAGAAAPLGSGAADDAPFVAIVGLEDDVPWVARQEEIVTGAIGPPAARLEGAQALDLFRRLADLEEQPGARLTFVSTHNAPPAIAALAGRPAAARAVFHAPAGRLHLFPDGGTAALAPELGGMGFTLTDVTGTDPIAPAVPPEAAIAALRGRIREALDPDGRMAFGARWAGGA